MTFKEVITFYADIERCGVSTTSKEFICHETGVIISFQGNSLWVRDKDSTKQYQLSSPLLMKTLLDQTFKEL